MTIMTKLGGTVALAALLAASSATQAQAQQKLKIGAVMALTGSLSAYGETSLNGVKLAIEEINKAGGVLGQPVELVVGDDQTSPQAGVDAAQKLVSIDKVHAIIGALSSGSTIPIASTVTSKAGIPQISGASTSPVITTLADNDVLFRTVPSDAAQGIAMAQVAKEMKIANVSVIYLNNDYGKGLAESFSNAFKATGGKIASMAPYAEKQASYRGELQKAAQGKPDALVLIAYPGDGIPILRQGLEGGFFSKFLFSDGMKAPEVVKAIGQKFLATSAGTAPEAMSDSPTAKSFADAYKAKFGELPPKPYIDAFYDATILIGLAAEKAKSTDGKAIIKALREVANAPGEKVGPGAFAKAKQLLAQGKDVDYVGAAGNPEFDKNGDVTGTFSHWVFKDDTVRTIKVFEPK
jgi:branched-chain amino acid transport system substrate-binding protein